MSAKGYVVRGKDKRGNVVTGDGIETTAAAVGAQRTLIAAGCTDVVIFGVAEDGTEERLPSYEKALGELVRLREVLGCKAEEETHVVAERLLTEIERCVDALKGAIGPTPADPLAALEAAERRLLEAGGWTLAEPDVYGNERWSHPTWQGGRRSEGRQMALTIERRRLAAKGGA